MSKGCMQSFDLLALKLRPWCSFQVMDRHSFWVFLYIVRYVIEGQEGHHHYGITTCIIIFHKNSLKKKA